MHVADWTVLVVYLVGTVLLGVFLGKLVKSSSDMFAAGGKSPWWTSGLSAFMTMFSANTFVVWGGIAYEYGVVAIVINLCYGIAAMLAGYTVAGKWKKLKVATPAEYIERRFGRGGLHFYTWFMMTYRIIGAAGALYAISLLVLAVMGGESTISGVEIPGGKLTAAIMIFALIIMVYTMIGGLWAVLMTDTLQFIILNLAVIFVIPLTLAEVGGFTNFFEAAPAGFLSAVSPPKYTWFFLAGWVAIHYFMIGAEWAFVQRYLCVPSPRDARKSAYLFGGLYLFSPFLWLLPPLLWRVQSPIPEGASPDEVRQLSETAYILSCKAVLPVGMLGLMLAAMFSATASLVSSQLNVFSGVLTNDIWKPFAKDRSEGNVLKMGRIFTVVLGLVIAGIAALYPMMGGAVKVIVGVTQLMVVPLLAPTLFSMLSRKITASAIWWTVGISFPLGLLSLFNPGLIEDLGIDGNTYKTFTGVVLPILICLLMMFLARNSDDSPGFLRCRKAEAHGEEDAGEGDGEGEASDLPAKIVGWAMFLCAAMMFALVPVNTEDRGAIAIFGAVLALLGVLILGWGRMRTLVRRS